MTTPPNPVPKVYRGSNIPVRWQLWTDVAAEIPRLLPSNAVAIMTISKRGKTTLTKRSDETDGLSLFVGSEAVGPAVVIWTPTQDESRQFGVGRAHVEMEYRANGVDMPLLLQNSSIEFVNGLNDDADDE